MKRTAMIESNVTFDEIKASRNKCNSVKCVRCNHADMLLVERSYSCVRCGCESGKNCGTWAMGYPFAETPPEECPDFSEVVDEKRKRIVNMAWLISCDRKLAAFRSPGNHPVHIAYPQWRIPFPEESNLS